MLRGNNRRRLFSYSDDYGYFLWLVRRALAGRDALLHAIALMINHVHLLVTVAGAPELGALVKAFAQRYAQYRNQRRDASGKLFEQRYHCKPVLDDEYLAAVTAYIDLNPLRAGLVSDPLEYPWTTYGIHVGEPGRSAVPLEIWTPSPWYSALAPTPAERGAKYREMAAGYAERFDLVEPASVYTKRLERPDRSRAAEPRDDELRGSG